MARYVVLSFEDNDDADRFVEYASSGCVASLHRDSASDDPQTHNATIVGMYAQPTVFCDGSGAGGCSKGRRAVGWTRGKKYGWWVCVVCKKPSKANLNDETLMKQVIRVGVNFLHQRIIPQAVNLLDEEPRPDNVATVNHEGWGDHSHA